MTARTSADVRALWPYARYFPRLVALTAAAGLLSSLAEGLGVSLFIPLLHELDRGALAGGPSDRFAAGLTALFAGIPSGLRLWVVGSCILGAVLVRSCLSYATQLLYAALDERVGTRLRSGIFAQLLELEFGYWERRGSDELFHTLADETWRTSEALKLMVSLVVTCSALAVYLLVVLLIDWKMTLIVSLAMLALHTLTRKLTGRAAALGRLVARTNTALTKRMIEAFEGMKVIRVFARERYEQQRFDAASRRVGRALMRTARMQALSGPVMELLTAILVVGLVVTAGSRQQDLPTLLVFLFILYRLQPKVRDLSNALVALATLQAAVEHVTALLRRDDKPYTSGGSLPFQGLRQGIRFDRVSFAYGDDEPALHEVTAFIPQGRTTALVGPSGAGKSTFVKLLQRLYDPTGGEITFDDQPLAAFELGSLRRRIAVVSQDVYLFDRSVRSNIAYGRSDAGLEQVIEAARQADAHGFIMEMAGGYEARVGERGDGLSGGQAQRIALARAIVARPDLLILDEATNSLDSISESVVRDALAALHGKCTIVIVAHRFDTIERADNIIVIDAGRVREQGSFRSLLGRGGLFAQLHALQSRGAASDRAGGYG